MFVSWTLIHDLVICVVVFASSTLGSVVTAKGKPVSSSSIRDASQGPEKAVDGDTRSTVQYIFHTEPFLSSAWWSVDLGEVVDSPQLTIYFRTDATARRNGVRISLSPGERSANNFCHVITGAADGSDIPDIYNFTCAARGRYLNISTVTDNTGEGAILDFGEVEVYGSGVTARGKPVSSSSIRGASYRPEKAVDGDTGSTYPNIFHTKESLSSAWWSVDLGEVVDSPQLTIYFRTDATARRNGVRISLSPGERSANNFCHVITGAADGSDIQDIYNFTCAARGRYLNISTVTDNTGQGAILDFGEVEVYACSLYTFGPGCSSECHCAEESCNWSLEAPTCPAGCLPGWKSVVCDTLVSACGVSVYMKPANTCDVPINFNFEPVALTSVLEMENLDLESHMECSHNCVALVLCVSFEHTASTCTLWRAGSSGLSGSRDMWKK